MLKIKLLLQMMKLPTLLTRPFGRGVKEVNHNPVSDRLRWLLRLANLEPVEQSVHSKRKIYQYLSSSNASGPLHKVHIENYSVETPHSIPIRLYRPYAGASQVGASQVGSSQVGSSQVGSSDTSSNKTRPAFMWLHGGGWVIGDLETHDRFCRRLCVELNIIIVAIDYRLAPEYPFPAAIEDSITAWQWLMAQANHLQIDRTRMIMGGDSAGGNLTAVLCQQLPVSDRPAIQVLCYPATDCAHIHPSRKRLAEGYLLTEELIQWFLKRYCKTQARLDPRISPLLNPVMKDQPPALVITAGLDPLCDEGRLYAQRLIDSRTQVEQQHEANLIHGFITLTGLLPEADQAVQQMCQRIKRMLDQI
jgi:acetyl esterase